MARKMLPVRRCLVISDNGDGEGIGDFLKAAGLTTIPAGSGREGMEAIGHFRPELTILFFHPGKEGGVLVLRALQALCQNHPSPAAIIISSDTQAVESLLGKGSSCRKGIKILPGAASAYFAPVPEADLKEAMSALHVLRV